MTTRKQKLKKKIKFKYLKAISVVEDADERKAERYAKKVGGVIKRTEYVLGNRPFHSGVFPPEPIVMLYIYKKKKLKKMMREKVK